MGNGISSWDESEVLAVTRQLLIRQDPERQILEMEARIKERRSQLEVQQEEERERRNERWRVEGSDSITGQETVLSGGDQTVFVMRKRSYKFMVLTFGLSNAPAVFQRLMDLVLAELTRQVCLTFLDDVIVMPTSFEQHLERLLMVFKRLWKANLKLNPTKCKLFQKRMKFKCSIISEEGIDSDPEKCPGMASSPLTDEDEDLCGPRIILSAPNYLLCRYCPTIARVDTVEPAVQLGDSPTERLREVEKMPGLSSMPLPTRRYILDRHLGSNSRGCSIATARRRDQSFCLCQLVAEYGREELLYHSQGAVGHHLRVETISSLPALDSSYYGQTIRL